MSQVTDESVPYTHEAMKAAIQERLFKHKFHAYRDSDLDIWLVRKFAAVTRNQFQNRNSAVYTILTHATPTTVAKWTAQFKGYARYQCH
jgi:hypothetical protein